MKHKTISAMKKKKAKKLKTKKPKPLRNETKFNFKIIISLDIL